jgi:hypothetical protein
MLKKETVCQWEITIANMLHPTPQHKDIQKKENWIQKEIDSYTIIFGDFTTSLSSMQTKKSIKEHQI